jgi:AraC family transcriptional activator of tynA and feaB
MEKHQTALRARGPSLQVWDSRSAPPKRAFATYREGVCSSFMPWTPEPANTDGTFEGRIESVGLGDCAIGISTTTGLRAIKSKANIEASPVECIYGNYMLSGEMTLEQADRRTIAKAGDLVIYQSHKQISLTEKVGALNRSVGFYVPVSRFSDVPTMDERSLNIVLTRETLIEPLAACLRTLAGNLRSSSPEEIASVLEACVALLPLSLGCFSSIPLPHRGAGGTAGELLAAIDDRLAEPGLTPARVAAEIGISTRQLHKQFARLGTSFGRYVTIERLERVRGELLSSPGRRAPISELAFRWGFNDLTTFNRAFRRHFGVQPRSLRENGRRLA